MCDIRRHLPHDVSKPNTQVIANAAIDADLVIGRGVIGQNDANRFTSAFTFQHHRVTSEQLQLIHLGLCNASK